MTNRICPDRRVRRHRHRLEDFYLLRTRTICDLGLPRRVRGCLKLGAQVAAQPARGGAPSWTPARVFMAASAVWHLPLGIVGLVYDRTFPIGADAAASAGSDHIFGTFETNGWHSLAALVLGAISLYIALRPERAREGALAIGIFHVGVVVALAVWGAATFWLASNTADQIVHSFTALGGIVSGLMTSSRRLAS